jgi:RNA polymerase sigma-70 factor (ECF subfamily)
VCPTRDPKLLADEDLMELVRGRDAGAFEVIYDRHADAAYSLAFRMLGARGPAEEVVQDAFLVVWRNSARYRAERGSVRVWLLGVVSTPTGARRASGCRCRAWATRSSTR